ncbi:MAG: FliM/FliN family flagellar motor switch protein [Armatimonadota bacterium]
MIYAPGHPCERPSFARAEGLTLSQMRLVRDRLRAGARSLSWAPGEEVEPHLWLRECRAVQSPTEMPTMAVAALALWQTEPGGVVGLEAGFGSRLVDRLLGSQAAEEPRALSEVDMAVLGDWLEQACARLLTALAGGRRPAGMRLGRLRTGVPAPEAIGEHVLAAFSPSPEGDVVLELRLAVPAIKRLVGLEAARAGQQAREALAEAIRRTRLRVQARLLVTELPAADVLNLAVGDVVVLDIGPEEPAHLLVNGRPKFRGRAGIMAGALSFEVATAIEAGDTE